MRSVTTTTLIIIGVVIGVLLLLLLAMSVYLTNPLRQLQQIAQRIIEQMAYEERKRDFSTCVTDAFHAQQSRRDEIGALTHEFLVVVCLLHNRTVEKLRTPKYPPNPFHVGRFWQQQEAVLDTNEGDDVIPPPSEGKILTWDTFISELECVGVAPSLAEHEKREQEAAAAAVAALSVSSIESPTGELDVLASLKVVKPLPPPPPPAASSLPSAPPAQQAGYLAIPIQDSGPQPHPLPDVHESIETPIVFSLHTKFWMLLTVLLAALLAIMCVTIITLKRNGGNWMTETSADMSHQQIAQLGSLVAYKSLFITSFIVQMYVDMRVMAVFTTAVLTYNLTTPSRIATHAHYLPSYANNPYPDPYTYPNAYAEGLTLWNFSSYFYKESSSCGSNSGCYAKFQDAYNTKLTSLLDLKMQSYGYRNSYVSVIQFALRNSSLIRNYPYTSTTALLDPATCPISDTATYPFCLAAYESSACAYPSLYSVEDYPSYDPRCRTWFGLGLAATREEEVILQTPRLSSAGQFIVTTIAPIFSRYTQSLLTTSTIPSGDSPQGQVEGVVNFNVLMSRLSEALNAIPILTHGYSYLLDTTNTSLLIVHPRATVSCTSLYCAEGFSSTEEWAAFQSTVLIPLQNGQESDVATSYVKNGELWYLAFSDINYQNVAYTVISTVPERDILRASEKVNSQIKSTIISMSVALALCVSVVVFSVGIVAREVVRSVVHPILELKSVMSLVIQGDLSATVAGAGEAGASSFDMKLLLDAFVNLMVAMRFGSESYARGHRARALQAFEEALQLYTLAGNLFGIASAHNNMAAALLELGNYPEAEIHFLEAIRIGEELINNLTIHKTNHLEEKEEHEKTLQRLRRVVSDRRGNLVVLRLHQEDFPGAFALLETLLVQDKRDGYIMGCIIKQGILGHYYLTQGELASAERVFNSALAFIRTREEAFFATSKEGGVGSGWNLTEAAIAEQIALYNVGILLEKQRGPGALNVLLESLSKFPDMHTSTTMKTLTAIHRLFLGQRAVEAASRVLSLAEANNLSLTNKNKDGTVSSGPKGGGRKVNKRIAFVLDYSGSMSGSKIRTAVENIGTIVETHVTRGDSVMVVHFTERVVVDFDLAPKEGNETTLKNIISNLKNPRGSTALYDAIHTAATTLTTTTPSSTSTLQSSDWVIALTDGEDNSSCMKHDELITFLCNRTTNHTNLIILGVGGDVRAEVLEPLAKATERGVYIFAQGDKSSIDSAFGEVVSLIEGGQVIIED